MSRRRASLLMPLFLLGFLPSVSFASSIEVPDFVLTHRMMYLVIQLGLILFAAKIGSIIFEKLRMPGVLGELVSGILIGPYALGQLAFYGFPHGIFPALGGFLISPELFGISAIAAVVLLFMVGLETDLSLLLRYSFVGGLVGFGGVVVAFTFGAGTLSYCSEMLFGKPIGFFHPISLFAGITATATSVGITARILSEKRKLNSPEGVTILSAAVIDDVIGIILLAVVMGIVTASKAEGVVNWGHIIAIAVKATGVWLVATAVGLIASRKISFLLKLFRQRTSIAIMALGLALILAGFFEQVGLAMIIGAYVMGLTLSSADIKHTITEKLDGIYAFLVPVFFCVTGMQINLSSLGSRPVIIFAILYTLTGLLSKIIGCGIPALFANFNLRGAMRIGFGMAPRGEVGLIIAGIGLSSHLLTPELFAAIVIMVAVNTLLAPPALILLFRNPKSGLRKSGKRVEKNGAAMEFDFPSLQIAEFFTTELCDVFESEGFFTHQISRDQKLYECRKDSSTIGLHCAGRQLKITCRKDDVPLITTAMYEGFAALESAIDGLRKPLDANSIGTLIKDGRAPPEKVTMSLRNYIKPNLIKTNLSGTTKEEIIGELVSILVENNILSQSEAAQAKGAAVERENSMSTGMQYGVAIPHGKTNVVDHLVCAVGIKREGVDFKAMDGKPSKIFFLTLSPTDKPAPHVHFMSAISQVLTHEKRQQILNSQTANEIYLALVNNS